MTLPRTLLRATALTLAAFPLACGGSVSPFSVASNDAGALDGGGPEASPPDASDGGSGGDAPPPWSPVCPEAAPTIGSTCSTENLQCEYGSAWWSVSCDTVVWCQSGQWATFRASSEPCSQQPGTNSSSCPTDFASAQAAGACEDHGLSCVYPQGECSCQVPLGGPVEIDGGTAYWGCVPEQGCPFPRPRLGSACSAGGTNCTYEACSYAQSCQDGVWQGEAEACGGALGSQ